MGKRLGKQKILQMACWVNGWVLLKGGNVTQLRTMNDVNPYLIFLLREFCPKTDDC